MVVDYNQDQSALSAQQKLAAQLLQPLLARRRPERILVMKHAGAGDLPLQLVNSAQIIRLSSNESDAGAGLLCRIEALPFEEAIFDLVILHHLVSDGSEKILAEALRVLAAGGDIVISGLNSSGLRNRIANRKHKVPAIKMNRVCRVLKSQSFSIEQCLSMGLGGLSRPAPKAAWHGLRLPFADRVVLHGHHQSNMQSARILRFREIKSAPRPSAALDGCSNREAAS
ncbi:MAG TPA: class I SAM-dependent methyltransferase [Xanthomonadales bacterium]